MSLARQIHSGILVDGLGIACFIVGHDFRFGHNRGGDFSLLQKSGEEFGFEVIETAAYERNGQRISSSFIREQLAESNFELVEQLLGRPFSMKGEVVRGQKLGSDLGFPTCNVNPHRMMIPLHGVFACQVRLGDRFVRQRSTLGIGPQYLKMVMLCSKHIFWITMRSYTVKT